jgi:hypothetical protein
MHAWFYQRNGRPLYILLLYPRVYIFSSQISRVSCSNPFIPCLAVLGVFSSDYRIGAVSFNYRSLISDSGSGSDSSESEEDTRRKAPEKASVF